MASETAAKPSAEENRQIIEVHIKEKIVRENSGEASAAGGYSPKRLMELGLGRGVDITDPTPWKHKAICQV